MNGMYEAALLRQGLERASYQAGPPVDPVYLVTVTGRVISASLSTPGTLTKLPLNPQPEVSTPNEHLVDDVAGVYKTGDRIFTVSGQAATRAQIEAASEIHWGSERLYIRTRTAIGHGGQVVSWKLVAGIVK